MTTLKRRNLKHESNATPCITCKKLFLICCGFIVSYRFWDVERSPNSHLSVGNKPIKVLHIVTSLVEYNNGRRGTTRGDDRLVKILIPAVKRTVDSIVAQQPAWEVDVYLILGFEELKPERRQLIVDSLPPGTGLEVWHDAIPLHYDKTAQENDNKSKVYPATHALARQHRFVLRDKLEEYDVFSVWEDDMRITATHIENFLTMNEELEILKMQAASLPEVPIPDQAETFHGAMSASQLERVIPGFIRVEVVQDEDTQKEVKSPENVPIASGIQIDPLTCCTLAKKGTANPRSDDLVIWETSIIGFGVRHFPGSFGWLGLLPGTTHVKKEALIGSYWSGADGAFDEERPGTRGDLFAQQGGFMATRDQIKYFDNVCPGGFLPPFQHAFWDNNSGLKKQNVEFWSGGYQLFGKCQLQRVVSLDPEIFSKQLIYHSADNKQRTKTERLIKANDLLGQLLTVKDIATAKS